MHTVETTIGLVQTSQQQFAVLCADINVNAINIITQGKTPTVLESFALSPATIL